MFGGLGGKTDSAASPFGHFGNGKENGNYRDYKGYIGVAGAI